MRSIAVLIVLALAARLSAQPSIVTSYTPVQLVAFNQAPHFICPVDETETPFPLAEPGVPKSAALTCMAGVEVLVPGAPGRAHDLLGGRLGLRLVSENPLRYEDEFHGVWLGRLAGSSLILRPDAPRGYAFAVKDGALSLSGIVGKADLSKILAARKASSKMAGNFALHEDLPANVQAAGETLQSQ